MASHVYHLKKRYIQDYKLNAISRNIYIQNTDTYQIYSIEFFDAAEANRGNEMRSDKNMSRKVEVNLDGSQDLNSYFELFFYFI